MTTPKRGTTNASTTDATTAQTSTATAGAEAATSQATATTTANAGAVVSAEAASAADAPAPRGHGGHYRKVNGARVLVERTLPADEVPEKAATAGKATKADQA